MFYSKINLQTELIRERSRQQRLMNDVYKVLHDSIKNDLDVLDRLHFPRPKEESGIQIDAADQSQLFTLAEIRNTCIRFRLRFLDTQYFKAEYPYEVVLKIHAFEKKYQTRIEHFKIAAPDHTFNLENINKDPMLFAQLADGRFYLIHQWGKDLAWYKRFTCWPVQSFKTYFISLWLAAFLFAFLLPISIISFFNFESAIYLRMWLMIHTFIGLFGLTLWAGLSFDKTFSSLNWDSKYYNY